VQPGERLAAAETLLAEVQKDIAALLEEWRGIRDRLHKQEKASAGLLELQKELHRRNEWRIRRMTVAIMLGGLAVSLGMLAIALATILTHHH